MPDRDIVDEIDELVDWQMSQYDNRSGYDRNVNQARCPHPWCDTDWHGLAITRDMQHMRRIGYVDPEYRYADDTSQVVCPGSNFDGEFTPPTAPPAGYDNGGQIAPAFEFPRGYYDGLLRPRNPFAPWAFWQLPDDPSNPNEWLAAVEPQWWRCDDVSVFEHVRLTDEVDDDGWPSQPLNRITIARCHYLVVDGEQIELRRSSDGHHARWGATPGEPVWLEVYAVCPPHVQHWRLLDPPADREQPVVQVLREEDGWQELGTSDRSAGPRFEPTDEDLDEAAARIRAHRLTPFSDIVREVLSDADLTLNVRHYEPAEGNPVSEARKHLILAETRRAATNYAQQHGFDSRPLIITRREACRGLDPSRYVIHYLGNPDLLDEIRMRLHNGVTLESLMYTPGDNAA